MKRLVILSDLNGLFLSEQIDAKMPQSKQFDVVEEINSIVLAGVGENLDHDDRHRALIEGGIDAAAEKLVLRYPGGITVALGLSVGGVILWRAAQKGLSIGHLICFSSTRLRLEKNPLKCESTLYYGENDKYRPEPEWFQNFRLQEKLVRNAGHEFYRTSDGVQIFIHELNRHL